MQTFNLALWFVCLFIPNVLLAQSWQAQSGDKQAAVLELFTSEGCGLCPAADRWVESLIKQGMTDEQLIVLGFHIDYLNDRKGWVDKFASSRFTERQKQLAHLNLEQTVYTPEFVVSGEVIHLWKKHVKAVVDSVNGFTPEASITLNIEQQDNLLNLHGDVRVEGEENRQYSKLYLAVVEDNVSSEVKGGDNAGATFNHQHLVRKWIGPLELNGSGNSQLTTQIEIDSQWDLTQISVVAVVQNLNDSFVLQGLALPLN